MTCRTLRTLTGATAGRLAALCGLLLLLAAPAAPAIAAGTATAPQAMPAHPDLLARLGKTGVAALEGEPTPVEMYTSLRDRRAKSTGAKLMGTGTCLVILWQFADHPADAVAHPATSYSNLLFSTATWPTGSMNDYFREVSYGAFGVGGAVSGWTMSSKAYSSYVPDDFVSVRTMIQDAIIQLDPSVNFALYDNEGPDGIPHSGDDDGFVDALFFVHAGPGQEETGNANDIWSHAWYFPGGLLTADGVFAGRYSVEPEETASGALVAIGVFCHEFGHVLGLPDLYDLDYSSSGVGEWCLMAGGGWNNRPGQQAGSCPAHPLAWCKALLGWLAPTAVTATATGVAIPPAETSATAYRIFRGGAATGSEYFLVENRRPLGFDGGLTRRQVIYGLPQPEGLLITHVDESISSNVNEKHKLVDVVEATPWFTDATNWFEHLDGLYGWSNAYYLYNFNRGDNGDVYPGFGEVATDAGDWLAPRDRDRFADDTIPSALDYSCAPTGIAIDNIVLSGDDVVADFAIGAVKAEPTVPTKALLVWDFESGPADWLFCDSYAHVDQTLAGGCPGASGMWFGVDDPDYVCPPGYGNGWEDVTWHPILVAPGATVTITHKYDTEPNYDYGYVEVRCRLDDAAAWHVLAAFDGTSGCVTETFAIPLAAISECADPVTGYADLDLRLRFSSDSGWSAEDGDFCGFGWWVDEISVNHAVTGVGEGGLTTPNLPAALLPAAPNPFNPLTVMRFHVPSGAREVALGIYDQRGRLVRTLLAGGIAPGWLEQAWDGRDDAGRALGSGVYFARLTVDGAEQTQKLALVR